MYQNYQIQFGTSEGGVRWRPMDRHSCDIFTSLLEWCSGQMLNIITTYGSKEHWGHLFNTDDPCTCLGNLRDRAEEKM